MVAALPAMAERARGVWQPPEETLPDYVSLVQRHNPRRR